MVPHALQHPLYRDIETIVRVNALDSEWGVNDLEAVVRGGADVVRLPKTDTAGMFWISKKRSCVSKKPVVVNPAAPACWRRLNTRWALPAQWKSHASERLIGIALGAEDYVRNLRTERSPEGTELLFARCSFCRPRALRVFRRSIPSIPTRQNRILQEPPTSNSWALTANRTINPRQIDLLHNLYAPTQKEVDHARRVVEAAEAAAREGLGVVSLNGKMVDSARLSIARLVLSRAELSGIREE